VLRQAAAQVVVAVREGRRLGHQGAAQRADELAQIGPDSGQTVGVPGERRARRGGGGRGFPGLVVQRGNQPPTVSTIFCRWRSIGGVMASSQCGVPMK